MNNSSLTKFSTDDIGVNVTGTIDGVSPHLMEFQFVHFYLVFVLGTFGNGVALWCIARCSRLQPAVKVLLSSVFTPLLLLCLVTRPALAHFMMAIYRQESVNKTLLDVIGTVTYALIIMELISIANVSLFRVMAVCRAQRQTVGLRVAVAVVISSFLFSVFSAAGVSLSVTYLQEKWRLWVIFVLLSLNAVLPIVVTIASYAVMMIVVVRNRRRLTSIENSSCANGVVDQATRAMFAVLTTTLILGFPLAIYYVTADLPNLSLSIIFNILFSTHFIVDPVIFVCLNNHHRQQISEKMQAALAWVTKCCSRHLRLPPAAKRTFIQRWAQVQCKQAETTQSVEDP